MMVLLGVSMPAESAWSQSSDKQVQQAKAMRLILKDGSYERIRQYEIRGDRVRYFSVERNQWEELPVSLIDWAATENYARQSTREALARANEANEKAAKERSEEEAHTPTVAPRLRIPEPEGVFLLDTYNDEPELNRLAQNGADLNKNTKSNILRGFINPIAGSRQTVELKGQHARIQSHVLTPALYYSIDPSDPSTPYTAKTAQSHLRIVRCEEKKGNRVVGAFAIAVYGKVKQTTQYIDARVEMVSDYWVKVTSADSLQPGEYALVELDEKGAMNQFVWDFGVNPMAPPNPAVIQQSPDRSEPALLPKSRKQ